MQHLQCSDSEYTECHYPLSRVNVAGEFDKGAKTIYINFKKKKQKIL